MSDLPRASKSSQIASILGGLPLAVSVLWGLKVFFELGISGNGYGFIAVAIYFLFCVLPITLLTLGLATFLFIRHKFPLLPSLSWLVAPTALVLICGLPYVYFKWQQEIAEYAELSRQANESNTPGPLSFLELSKNAMKDFSDQESFHFTLESSAGGVPNYNGYQLLSGNRIKISNYDATTLETFLLEPPSYERISQLVRDGRTDNAGAWLWPKQIETAVLVYDDRAEAMATLRHIHDDQRSNATRISLQNYTGENIGRVRINGWDLFPEILYAEFCNSPLNGWIPEQISTPLVIEWQILGKKDWHKIKLNELPPEPDKQAEQRHVGQGLTVILGYQGQIALRRELTVITDGNMELDIPGKETPEFSKFLDGYRGCSAIAAKRPRAVVMINQTNKNLEEGLGWFGKVAAYSYKNLNPANSPQTLSNGFIKYQLKPNQTIELRELTEGEAVSHKFLLPTPDYSGMTQLLRDFSELTPADFSTYFFIYTNRIESSLGITPHATRVTRPLHGITLYNFSTKNIARVQVNGWEITEPHQEEWSIPCGFYRTSRIPALAPPIKIRWHYKGEEDWQQSDITTIPSMPAAPPGIITDNIWYDIYLEKNSQQMQLVLHGLVHWTDGELGYSGEKWESGEKPNENCNN